MDLWEARWKVRLKVDIRKREKIDVNLIFNTMQRHIAHQKMIKLTAGPFLRVFVFSYSCLRDSRGNFHHLASIMIVYECSYVRMIPKRLKKLLGAVINKEIVIICVW